MLGRTITFDVCGFLRSSSSFQIYEHVCNGVLGVMKYAGGFGCAHCVNIIQNRLLDCSRFNVPRTTLPFLFKHMKYSLGLEKVVG
jgi:hypothetical protein